MQNLLNGYVTVRSFGGFAIPVPVQNGILREYAVAIGATYALPHGEYMFENCHMQLFSAIAAAGHGGSVVMCSLFMLPDGRQRFATVARAALDEEVSLHFVFERLVLKEARDYSEARQRMLLRRHTDEVSGRTGELRAWLRSNKVTSAA